MYNVVDRGVLQAMWNQLEWNQLEGEVGHCDQLIIC